MLLIELLIACGEVRHCCIKHHPTLSVYFPISVFPAFLSFLKCVCCTGVSDPSQLCNRNFLVRDDGIPLGNRDSLGVTHTPVSPNLLPLSSLSLSVHFPRLEQPLVAGSNSAGTLPPLNQTRYRKVCLNQPVFFTQHTSRC